MLSLISRIDAERARADKAEAELRAEQVAHLKTRARLTEAKRELARVRTLIDCVVENCEASASSHQERIETIHRIARAVGEEG
jgi:hypothetical protein